jgi:hypothetical protein
MKEEKILRELHKIREKNVQRTNEKHLQLKTGRV